ncbi:uncharacterized protein JN550_013599 [Neoarthrinium moseri]|uniref:uncharacterized protein n=1 Tax=Neoarthrinium moseri TaxID=1658444 RepID=UPI001FDC5155|nr:uncharacterized protein JN550_013599 [Neoarthrinium moseri]KAI1856892.1 hypothetical protein JN550_013599 [Neoarthrinium moseri]
MVTTTITRVQPALAFCEKLDSTKNHYIETGTSDRLPSVFECTVHLELLDAIVRVEGEVAEWGQEEGLSEGVAWDMYCSAAASRFIKWSQTAEANEEATPPLDIFIVWHAYMLNTNAYRQYAKQVFKARIGREGIDWAAVHDRIDEDNQFKMSADEAAPTKQSPLSVDLLSVLKNGEIKVEDVKPSPSASFDMVAAVKRQLKFAHKMHEARWLRSPFAGKILKNAIDRYEKFFTLIAEYPYSSLSPTPDIDLVWHTHQLSPKRYGLYSVMKANGRFVNHNDDVAKAILKGSFDFTTKLFRDRFGTFMRAMLSLQNAVGILAFLKPVPKAANLNAAAIAAATKTFKGCFEIGSLSFV